MKRLLQVFSFDVVSKVMLGAVGVLAIRYMPESQFALYTFALALASTASQTLSASFNRVYLLAYDTLRLEETRASFLGLQLLCLGALSLAGLAFAPVPLRVYVLVCALATATCLSDYAKTFFQRDLRFMRFSMVELLRSGAIFAGALAVIAWVGYRLSAWHLLAVQALAMLAVFWVAVGRRLALREVAAVRPALGMARRIAASDFRHVFAYFLVVAVFGQVDVLMLQALSDDVQLATYGSAFRYYAILSLALASLHAVLLPMIERAGPGEMAQMLARHRRLTFGFGLCVAALAWAADWFMPLIDRGRYPDAVAVFRILALSAVISFACSPHVNIIFRHRLFRFLLVLAGVALASAVLLHSLLIPRHGALGAACVTLVTSAMVTLPIWLRSLRLGADPSRIDAGLAP